MDVGALQAFRLQIRITEETDHEATREWLLATTLSRRRGSGKRVSRSAGKPGSFQFQYQKRGARTRSPSSSGTKGIYAAETPRGAR